jgi:hypothetical protein
VFSGFGLHQPLGQSDDEQSPRGVAGQTRDRRRQADLQSLPRTARFAALAAAGTCRGKRPQRLLWASTGTKDPRASDVPYIKALAAPFTVNTIPDATLLAFADHGTLGEPMHADGGDAEKMIAKFAQAGINHDQLAADLQREGAESFVRGMERNAGLHQIEERTQGRRLRFKSCPQSAASDERSETSTPDMLRDLGGGSD